MINRNSLPFIIGLVVFTALLMAVFHFSSSPSTKTSQVYVDSIRIIEEVRKQQEQNISNHVDTLSELLHTHLLLREQIQTGDSTRYQLHQQLLERIRHDQEALERLSGW